MSRENRTLALVGLAFVVWTLFAWTAVPRLIEQAFRGESLPVFNAMIRARDSSSVEKYLGEWKKVYFASCLVFVVVAAPLGVARVFPDVGSRFYGRFVPPATAIDLGMIRIVVFGFLLATTLWRDLPSVAELPPEIRQKMGVMHVLHLVPGWDRIYVDANALWWLKTATVAATFLAASGTFTRLSVPAATVLALVHDGILREYSHFFHTGLVPAYCGAVLSLTPCGDRLAVDCLSRKAPPPGSSSIIYGWARYACWIVIAGTYLCAGLSKLRNGGLWWWHADNLKPMILTTCLDPGHVQLGLSEFLGALPAAYYSILGLAGLLVELFYGVVLVSRRARLIVPLAAIGLHVGILVCQGIAFLDLIAIQAAFVNWGVLGFGKQFSTEALPGTVAGNEEFDRGTSGGHWRGLVLCAFLVGATAAVWIGRVEWYPLTTWKMFSGYSLKTTVKYGRVTALSEDGAKREICAARYIPAVLPCTDMAKLESEQVRMVLGAIKRVANGKRRADEPAIVSVALETWVWDFQNEPESPTFGHLDNRITDRPVAAEVWK